ncbi:unnamed protein product, partial [Brassica rapa subsp. narinosa]
VWRCWSDLQRYRLTQRRRTSRHRRNLNSRQILLVPTTKHPRSDPCPLRKWSRHNRRFLIHTPRAHLLLLPLQTNLLPPHKNPNRDAPLTSPTNKIFRLYVASAGIVGLLIPICYIFQGFLEDDKRGVSAAAPHVFLLASQVFMEGIAATCGFSAPARILVPVVYNARRILTLVQWIVNEFSREAPEYGKGTVSVRRMYAGKVLAAVNLGIWSFNLFGVLIPVYLPRAFKRYYGSSKEV